MDLGRALIVMGIVLIVVGLLVIFQDRLPFGRLPGDLVVERENFKFYFPVMTSLILSLVLSLIAYFFRR
jgi:hypothetical protein